ncbi:MAG: HD domain-containing protein [Planctomycetota bacterium]
MSANRAAATLVAQIRAEAPWLLAPELGTCIVGSAATAEACRRVGETGPNAEDVDLAWGIDTDEAAKLLESHGILLPTTEGSRSRGTLACRVGGQRIEITGFRGGGTSVEDRITSDLAHRDMTIGALAWWLGEDRILDPFDGMEHWRQRRIEPVGDPAARVDEHPIRYLRWFRRAHELGFEIGRSIRKLPVDPGWVARTPREAVAAELRRALDRQPSPGDMLVDLHETGALAVFAPELAPQFDGRPAGPRRHHPEIGQALHLALALRWAAAQTRDLDANDRNAVMVAVLTHDLGKNLTPSDAFPSHHGHEPAGVPLVRSLLDALPGLTDPRGRRLAEQVCRLHLQVRRLHEMKPGTLATLYDRELRSQDFPVALFALAVGADVGGRLGSESEGHAVRAEVERDLEQLRAAAGAVDAAQIRNECPPGDIERFRSELHAARARAIRAAGFGRH